MKLLILISATLSCMLMFMTQANAFDLTPFTGQYATQTEQSNSNYMLIDHHHGSGHHGGGHHGGWGGHHGGWGGHHGGWNHDWYRHHHHPKFCS